jgi:hypothetical protein
MERSDLVPQCVYTISQQAGLLSAEKILVTWLHAACRYYMDDGRHEECRTFMPRRGFILCHSLDKHHDP